MAAPNPLAGLPSAGAFPVLFSSSFKAAAKGRQANKEEVYGLRCRRLPILSRTQCEADIARLDKFKPASITPSSKGEVEMDKGHSKLVHFDGQVSRVQLLFNLSAILKCRYDICCIWLELTDTCRTEVTRRLTCMKSRSEAKVENAS